MLSLFEGSGDFPVEVVILSPVQLERTYYDTDGDRLCHSDDSVAPARDAVNPQSKKCSVCTQNQWGSRITINGKRGKGCADFIKLTLRLPDRPQYAETMRVPSTSIKQFKAFEKELLHRGETLTHVVTKISVVHEERRSKLTFRVVRFLRDDELDALNHAAAQSVSPFATAVGYTT
jgi:hypothetical protein|tara:strand:+ start:337 stop:864 length:528 start_codon:yes stop_codon:yes gene_type:complete